MPERVAQRFLAAFNDAVAAGRPLEALAGDFDGFAAALAVDPGGLAAAMAAAADGAGGAATVPDTAFAGAACTAAGRVVAADAAFAAWRISPAALAAAVRRAFDGSAGDGAVSVSDDVATTGSGAARPRLSAIADDDGGRPVALAIARGAAARAWPLGDGVRAALDSGAAPVAVLGVRPADAAAWPRIFAAWSFSPAEARLAGGLLRTGDLRRAAAEAAVTYETARSTLVAAMARTGARRQPEFVRQLALVAFGDLPAGDATWHTFADAFGLSARQGRLAHLIAVGATRAAAAAVLGISDHTAKADLRLVYDRCGAGGGAALGRIVAEVDALSRLAVATDVEIVANAAHTAPLRFVRRRRAHGRIAVEDHGPRGAPPVIVIHVPLNGRHLPRVLVAALHHAGLRPISVERPGFGLTTPAPGEVGAQACADLIDVLDALGLDRVRLLGRSANFALLFAQAHPERVAAGVLLSASPPEYRPTRGVFATLSALVNDHAPLVDSFARLTARLSSERAISALVERAIGACPADVAAFAVPGNRADVVRAVRQAATGNGFARELALQARGAPIAAPLAALDWTIVFGSGDPYALASGSAAAWRAALPRARIDEVAAAGRFVHLSHPERVAAALAALTPD